ncbi:MAG: hypothetical protein WCV67_12880 [Victivallaceae bacterium]|jgi:hypothetical protein
MKQFTSLLKAGSAAIAILAGNALSAGDAAALNPKTSGEWLCNWSDKGSAALTAAEAENALACKGVTALSSKTAVQIDPEKSYKLSGSFKLAPDSKPSKFYFGIMPLNDKGQLISSESVGAIADTETELAADCNPDDTVVKIKNGDKWKVGQFFMIAFKADDSGKKADLPNTELSGWNVVKVEKNGDVFDLTLKNKCGKKYAAGTKIREHRCGGTYIYIGADNKDVTADWTESAAAFKKADLWPGTCGAKILILANYGGKPDQVMMMKDVKLEEVK